MAIVCGLLLQAAAADAKAAGAAAADTVCLAGTTQPTGGIAMAQSAGYFDLHQSLSSVACSLCGVCYELMMLSWRYMHVSLADRCNTDRIKDRSCAGLAPRPLWLLALFTLLH